MEGEEGREDEGGGVVGCEGGWWGGEGWVGPVDEIGQGNRWKVVGGTEKYYGISRRSGPRSAMPAASLPYSRNTR